MDKLGVQPVLLLAQMVNFTIIVFVLNKLLYKPVTAFLDKRKKEIAQGLELTAKMKEEEEKTEKTRKKILDAAKADAMAIIGKAKKDAKNEAREILEQAQEESRKLTEKKRTEIDDEYRQMAAKLESQVVDLATSIVERLLPGMLTAQMHRTLIEKQLREIKKA